LQGALAPFGAARTVLGDDGGSASATTGMVRGVWPSAFGHAAMTLSTLAPSWLS
jgi:hypothetical protein